MTEEKKMETTDTPAPKRKPSTKTKEKAPKTLEEAFARLEKVTADLEKPDLPLEDSFTLYQEGMKLLKDVNSRIDRVEKEVQVMQADGTFAPMPPMDGAEGK